jgi:hypothetical protein
MFKTKYKSLKLFYKHNERHRREDDIHDNMIYYETSDGYWCKCEYDKNQNIIYCENSRGVINDKKIMNN